MRIVYWPEIPCVRTGDDEADLLAISQECLRFCENVIRQQPEYWLWFYQRWKFRPTMDRGDFPFYSRYIEEVRRRRAQAVAASQRVAADEEELPSRERATPR